MIMGVLILLLVLAALLLFFGFFLKKDWSYIGLAGAVLLTMTGLFLITDPLTFQSGETITTTGNVSVAEYDYDTPSNAVNRILSVLILLSGLFLFTITIIGIRRIKEEGELDVLDNDDTDEGI